MTQEEKTKLLNEQYSIILNNETKLAKGEYIAAKIAEERGTIEEYKEKINLKEQWVKEINNAQKEIERLESIEVEEVNMEAYEDNI